MHTKCLLVASKKMPPLLPANETQPSVLSFKDLHLIRVTPESNFFGQSKASTYSPSSNLRKALESMACESVIIVVLTTLYGMRMMLWISSADIELDSPAKRPKNSL